MVGKAKDGTVTSSLDTSSDGSIIGISTLIYLIEKAKDATVLSKNVNTSPNRSIMIRIFGLILVPEMKTIKGQLYHIVCEQQYPFLHTTYLGTTVITSKSVPTATQTLTYFPQLAISTLSSSSSTNKIYDSR